MQRRLLEIAALAFGTACAPTVDVQPAPSSASLMTVADLRRSVQDPGRVWLIVGSSSNHTALLLDSLPPDEVIAMIASDSVTPLWGPKRLAIQIERCGRADTLLTQRGRQHIRQSAPCPWASAPQRESSAEFAFTDTVSSRLKMCIAGRRATNQELRAIRRRDIESMVVVKSELPADHPTEVARKCDIDIFLKHRDSRGAR